MKHHAKLNFIEFVVKEKINGPDFIITGTPPHGKNSIDYGNSVLSRVEMLLLSDLRPPQIKKLLSDLFKVEVSPVCVLNFWTVFRGSLFLSTFWHENSSSIAFHN